MEAVRAALADVEDGIDGMLDAAEHLERLTRSIAGLRARVLARAVELVDASVPLFLAGLGSPDTRPALNGREVERDREMARRAFTNQLASRRGVHTRTADDLVSESEQLVRSAPRVLEELGRGGVGYRHTRLVLDQMHGLDGAAASAYEEAVLARIGPRTSPGQVKRVARSVRERLHPEPLACRHARAAAGRGVWIEPADDGMAHLFATIPAAVAAAVDARLDTAARALRRAGDTRGTQQLRADLVSGLLLRGPGPSPTTEHADAGGQEPGTAGAAGADGSGGAATVAELARLASEAGVVERITPRVHLTVPLVRLLDDQGQSRAEPEGQGGAPPE